MMHNQLLVGSKIVRDNNVKPEVKRTAGRGVIFLNPQLVLETLDYLESQYTKFSNCTKVKVACCLCDYELDYASYGVNYVEGVDSCEETFCKEDFSMSPKHRHGECRAIHSEIIALQNWYKTLDVDPYYAFVTRYPCERCLQRLSLFGVALCYYGGDYEYSMEETLDLEEKYGIFCMHVKNKKTLR